VLALLISGLGLWDSHRDRVRQEEDRIASRKADQRAATFVLTANAMAHDVLKLRPTRDDQVIQDQQIYLPSSIRSAPITTTGDARIESDWFADAVRKREQEKTSGGDHRLPVGIVTTYLADGDLRTDTAIYDIGYTAHSRFLLGSEIQLKGISLLRRHEGSDLQAAVSSIWQQRLAKDRPAS